MARQDMTGPAARNDGAGQDDEDQAALLAEIRDLYAVVDPVPDELISAAEASLDRRAAGAEIAQLTQDSACDTGAGGPVRGPGAVRLLAFAARETNIVVEIRELGGRRRILGQVSGRRTGAVQVRHRGGVREAAADVLGRFLADDVPAGPVSFACASAGEGRGEGGAAPASLLVTDWVAI